MCLEHASCIFAPSMAFHSIVIPVFNEAPGVMELYSRVATVIDEISNTRGDRCEVILVNDGSHDGSAPALDHLHVLDSRFKVLHLSRNFGHQTAVTAGLHFARGETVSVMDADLQDPPEVIHRFIQKWKEGYDVVYGVRQLRQDETWFKLWTARTFYRVSRRISDIDIPLDTGDFRLMDRKVVNAFLQFREKHRYVRGLVSWLGFRQTGIHYERHGRKHGQTHYPLRKMLKFAFDGLTSFSLMPLRIPTWLGSAFLALSLLGFFGLLAMKIFGSLESSTWIWVSLLIVFTAGAHLFCLGILGEYVGRTLDEVRQRPLFLIARSTGFSASQIQDEGRRSQSQPPSQISA